MLENVDLHKLLAMMERKEKRIALLEKADLEQSLAIDKANRNAEHRVKQAQKMTDKE